MRDEYYLFTMPEDRMCPVWVEVWLADGTHHVAPTPFGDMDHAVGFLKLAHPAATVDELDDVNELAEVRGYAATMPLEQIAGP